MMGNNNTDNVKGILLKVSAVIFAYFAVSKLIHFIKVFILHSAYISSTYFDPSRFMGGAVVAVKLFYVIAILIDIAIYLAVAIGLFLNKQKIMQIGMIAWTVLTLWVSRDMFRGIYGVYLGDGYGIGLRLGMGRGGFWILGTIILFLASILVMGIMAVLQSSEKNNGKSMMNSIWFLPVALRILSFVFEFLALRALRIFQNPYTGEKLQLVSFTMILWWLVFAFLGYGLSNKAESEPVSETTTEYVNTTYATQTSAPMQTQVGEGYISMGKHILLLFLTCGVWLYIWTYRMTDYTNQAKGEEYRNPTTKLLLCMFVPFYSIYWTYKTAMRIDKMAQEKGMHSDLSTLCLILAVFVPIIPPILMQDKVNAICTVNQPLSQPVAAQPVQAQPQPVRPQVQPQATQPVVDETELLKKYKELLDTGVITQEEFDAKKKQLLGL